MTELMPEVMEGGDIAFPFLNIYLHNVPKSISPFGFEIAFYGMILVTGMLVGLLLACREAKRTGQNPDIYWDFFIYAIIFGIVGARLYYVAFRFEYYKDDLLQIFNLRAGGIAIYGGVIGSFLTAFIFCRIKKLKPALVLDTCMQGLLAGQIIGRWGNFFNREVFGGYSSGPLAMRLPISAVRAEDISEALAATIVDGTNYIQVHPTFLYEGLWNLGVLLIIQFYKKHKKFDGELILIYLAGYGMGRAWIEWVRTDRLYIPGTSLAVSQLLAIVLVIFAVTADVVIRLNNKTKCSGESAENGS